MTNGRSSDAQIMSILKQAEGGVLVFDLCREHGMSSASLQMAGQIWRYGRVAHRADEGHGRAEPPPQEDVCGDGHAGGFVQGSPWKKS